MALHEHQSPELLATMRRNVSLASGERNPRAYQTIEISSPDDVESQQKQRNVSLRSVNSVSSMASVDRARKFACQFDPAVKNGSALVLKFDTEGVGTFEEVTRLALLRLTQEAARPSVDPLAADSEVAGVLSDEERGPTRRVKAKKTALRRPYAADPVDKNAPYATICDVQVSVPF